MTRPAVVVAFPGQGVDPVATCRALRARQDHLLVRELADLLGTDDWESLDLADTRVAQPAIYVAGLATVRTLGPGDAEAAVGHSLGEVAACAFAGALTDEAGLAIVAERARLGHDLHDRRPGRMAVVMQAEVWQLEWCRREAIAATGGVLEVAVVNGPGQVVLTGDRAATDHAVAGLTALGATARALPIGGSYHSPLAEPMVAPFRAAVEAADPRSPQRLLVSSTTQRRARTPDDVVELLTRALLLPVRWPETLDALVAEGVGAGVDAGPGQTVTNLARFVPTIPFEALAPKR